ncbi:MAG: response regulator [Fusobacteria bacterium]|nr:response regulator [Fusobacteriota bacterium]
MKRLFLVDDSFFMRDMLKGVLVRQNYEIVGEACNAANAILGVKETLPDVIILDIRLGESSGLEVLKKIKEELKEIKVIICSGVNNNDTISKAILCGADNYLIKPFSFKELFHLISN